MWSFSLVGLVALTCFLFIDLLLLQQPTQVLQSTVKLVRKPINRARRKRKENMSERRDEGKEDVLCESEKRE